jgi:UDP-N-acetylmuramyl pentapeptide phosphotransferase/UDP-N-acetylglucosamine-1-phosphate transferase
LLGVLVASANVGFLVHNWQPARVFMGDAGSAFLGFLLAAVPMTVASGETRPMEYAVLMTWPFLFDTGFTLLRRLTRRENVFSAHRTHLYQRYTQTRRSHQNVVLVYAGLASLGALAAVLSAAAEPIPALVLIAAIPVAAFCLWRVVTIREAEGFTRPPRVDVG